MKKEIITRNDNQYSDFFDDIKVSKEEVVNRLNEIKKEFQNTKLDELLKESKEQLKGVIINFLGVSKIASSFDKDGGNVDTVHNVREGVYATEEEKKKYEERGEYNKGESYRNHKSYKKSRAALENKQERGELYDIHTGEKIERGQKFDQEHLVSANEIHNDPGRSLADIDGIGLANDKSNLGATSSTVNRAKKDNNLEKFTKQIEEAKNRKQELEQKKGLTEKEQEELKKVTELSKVNLAMVKQARKRQNQEINKKYYTSKKFIKNTAKTSLKEGAKMGIQQAFARLLNELWNAIVFEVQDIWKNGFKEDDKYFFDVLIQRLERVKKKVLDKVQDIIKVFKDGFIFGLLSNIITVFINVFKTTSTRIVRIIREGVFVGGKAIIDLLTGEGSLRERMDAFLKALVIGGISISSIIINEGLENLLPFLKIFGVSELLTALIVGLTTPCAIYLLDKVDFFGVQRKARNEYIDKELDKSISETEQEMESKLENVKKYSGSDTFDYEPQPLTKDTRLLN